MLRRFALRPATFLGAGLFFILATCAAAAAQAPGAETQKVEVAVNRFWTHLGELDAEAMKQVVDFPLTVVESSANDAKTPVVMKTSAEFDEAFRRANQDGKKTRGQFYGVKPANLKIRLLGDHLAQVNYELVATPGVSRTSIDHFPVVTILRKDEQSGVWKIVFTNVPK